MLPNAWDVASAVAFARLPGCRALATTSAGVARSLGFEDGAAPGDEMLRVAARIAAAVDVPVSADLERGYDDPPATVAAAWAAGIVGANVEDSVGGGPPVPIAEQVELLRAVRAAAPELVLNARVDTFLGGTGDGRGRDRARQRVPRRGRRLRLPDPRLRPRRRRRARRRHPRPGRGDGDRRPAAAGRARAPRRRALHVGRGPRRGRARRGGRTRRRRRYSRCRSQTFGSTCRPTPSRTATGASIPGTT